MDATQGFLIQGKHFLFPHDTYEVLFPCILYPYDLAFAAFSSTDFATEVL